MSKRPCSTANTELSTPKKRCGEAPEIAESNALDAVDSQGSNFPPAPDLVDVFLQGQHHEAEDEEQEALSCYAAIVEAYHAQVAADLGAKPRTVFKYAHRESSMPPDELVASCAHNSLGSACLEVLDLKGARVHFGKALQLWPENVMALVNLGNLEREHGELEESLRIYLQAAGLVQLEYSPPETLKEEEEDAYSWEDDWICSPRSACLSTSTYLVCLVLHQLGRGDEANSYLSRFGFFWKVSSAVWSAVLQCPSLPRQLETGAPSSNLNPDEFKSVRLVSDAIPAHIASELCHAFRPESSFWSETDYANRGYFSFWFPVNRGAENIVEETIQRWLLPQCGVKSVVGAEWWVHTRPAGRNLGHQLHFDTEENALELEKKIIHPKVSSVCYLTGGGNSGPTVIFDQKVGDPACSSALVSHPCDRACLFFPGNRLHGVLPLPPSDSKGVKKDAQSSPPPISPPQRLTLMVGFWTIDVTKIGERRPLGPCSPLPAPDSDSSIWQHNMLIPDRSATLRAKEELFSPGARIRLCPASPAWDKVTPDFNPASKYSTLSTRPSQKLLPVPEDIDTRLFLGSMEEFRLHLLERALGSSECVEPIGEDVK